MAQVSIVLVGHNSEPFLKSCLQSLYFQTFKNIELIFIDNNSHGNSTNLIKNLFPEAKIIKNKMNLGFGKGNNQGINIATGEYILTLNCDVELDKDFLLKLIEVFQRINHKQKIGMLTGKILRKDKKTIDSAGLILTKFRRFYDRGNNKLDKGQFNKEEDVFGPCAAAALYKRKMLEDIKTGQEYFDEDFFLFVEDVDLAWRSQKKGWKSLYVPEAICYHQRHSCGYDKSLLQYYSFRNRYFMITKNDRFGIWSIFSFFLYDIPRIFYLILTNRNTLRALIEMIRLTNKMLAKRNFQRDYRNSIELAENYNLMR